MKKLAHHCRNPALIRMVIGKHVMTAGDVAKALGLKPRRVRQLDAELQPIRTEGNQRRYDPERVAAVSEQRGRKMKAPEPTRLGPGQQPRMEASTDATRTSTTP